jgi:hypothetical protein
MNFLLRYHSYMRYPLTVLLVMFGMVAAPSAHGQINGTRASVTSLGGNPSFPPGPRASVTSLGPNGFSPNFRSPNCCFSFRGGHHRPNGFGNGRRGLGFGVLPLYSMPYYYGYGDVVNPVDDTMEQGYGAGTDTGQSSRTAAQNPYQDERLSRLEHQMDELENTASAKTPPVTQQPPVSLADQPDTVLVFRDGHSADVKNYAIVGDTLYDLSNGARKKIALADLDVNATQKQNEDRGLDFRLPTRPLGY